MRMHSHSGSSCRQEAIHKYFGVGGESERIERPGFRPTREVSDERVSNVNARPALTSRAGLNPDIYISALESLGYGIGVDYWAP